MKEEEEFEELDGEIIPLSDEEAKEIMKVMLANNTPVQPVVAPVKKTREQKYQEKIGFLVSLLSAGIALPGVEGATHKYLIDDDHYYRSRIQKHVMDLTEKYLKS